MKAWNLDDPWARNRRAVHHLRVLEDEHGLSSSLTRHRVRVEVHRGGLEYRFYLVETVPPLADVVPFIISECLFNLRSALDQLVYALHVRHFRGTVPARVAVSSSFPILD